VLAAAGAAAMMPLLPRWAKAADGGDAALYRLFDHILADRSAGVEDGGVALDRLRAMDPAALSPRGRLDRVAVLDTLDMQAALRRVWPHGTLGSRPSPFTISPQAGAWRTAADRLAQGTPDARDAAVQGLARQLDQETERLAAEADAGIILPRPLLEQTLARLRALSLPGEAGAALSRQAAVLETMRPKAPDAPGLGRLPGGQDGYAAMLVAASTLRLTPDDAHRMGRTLADTLTAEAAPLFQSLGLTDGSPGERFRALALRPEHAFPDSAGGRDAAVAVMNAHLARVRPLLPTVFGELPDAEIRVQRLTDAEMAAGRQGWRDNPSFDGRRSGGYHVDLSRIAERPRFALPTMTDHETLPGHLLQAAWQQRADLHPLRARLVSGAILEGWSAYAQMLTAEMGVYGDDPAALLGVIQSLLFRVGRMLADTGLHARGWSREQAIRTITELGGEPERVATAEVDRMSVLPGFLTGHMVGYVHILRLRDARRATLGAGFDLRRFHDACLSPGPLPLSVLGPHLAGEYL